ncbi:type II toxin-antitoxin system VapC family toxin [Propionivibrio sp.]|uniref:type II toxin-antitoxin system VapC family toxin n=1 Tax=Propionivibrio sp. TaxID=2212460 RepID=UPI003BEFD405
MLIYLLDTDICSDAIKRKQPALLSKIRAGLVSEEIAISAITRGELLYGLELVPDATTLKIAVFAFLDYMPCLEWPVAAADHYAKLRSAQKITGNLVGYMDTLIACHALAENLILVTNNERDFARIPGLSIENWTV